MMPGRGADPDGEVVFLGRFGAGVECDGLEVAEGVAGVIDEAGGVSHLASVGFRVSGLRFGFPVFGFRF